MIVISKRALIEHLFDEGTIEGFFPKPIDVKGLILKIDELLRQSEMLELLEKMDGSAPAAQANDSVKIAGTNNRIKREICQRCAHVLLEEEGSPECCPVCGYPGFYVEEVD